MRAGTPDRIQKTGHDRRTRKALMRRQVLLAPDKFKGSLTATEAASRLMAGLHRVCSNVPVVMLPVADGGEGTIDAAVTAGFQRRRAPVSGPTGQQVVASYAVRGRAAIVEMAEASGLSHLPGGTTRPLAASSRGTGELIDAAIEGGANHVVLGLGGSACTDGGTGMATALGMRFLDHKGRELPPGGSALRDLHAIVPGDLPDRLAGITVIVASDVDNPLLGPDGTAGTFGPQKGADWHEIGVLEDGLARLDEITRRDLGRAVADRPGAGSAGGSGYGAMAFLGATVESGISYLLDLLRLPVHLNDARLVITGEGSLDWQTLRGKAPAGVARLAARSQAPVVAVCGQQSLTETELRNAGFAGAYALVDIEPDVGECVANAGPLLERLAERVATDWLTPNESRPLPFDPG